MQTKIIKDVQKQLDVMWMLCRRKSIKNPVSRLGLGEFLINSFIIFAHSSALQIFRQFWTAQKLFLIVKSTQVRSQLIGSIFRWLILWLIVKIRVVTISESSGWVIQRWRTENEIKKMIERGKEKWKSTKNWLSRREALRKAQFISVIFMTPKLTWKFGTTSIRRERCKI